MKTSEKGAIFLTEPWKNPDGWEWRCYMRDPDGYLIEVGQYTQLAIDSFKQGAIKFRAVITGALPRRMPHLSRWPKADRNLRPGSGAGDQAPGLFSLRHAPGLMPTNPVNTRVKWL